jgi:subtilisin-like proprotein convertase family protein
LGHAIDVTGLTECTPYIYSVDSGDLVGNLATDDAGGAYYTFTTGKTAQPSYASTDTPMPIPDNNPVGATSTIAVPDARIVQDVNVTINVQHTFDGDLALSLITPAGQTIALSNPRGGSGDNYTNTILDDEAAGPISGSAPFTGTFRPDSPLSVADGINAAGNWQFKAVDKSPQDVGQILNWTLQLTYATPSCGPHAIFRSQARVADTCVTGGPGQNNTYWDAGENVQVKLNLANDGTTTLTGVTATVSSTTPGVTMTGATASFPDIPASASADSLAPHVTAHLAASLACGATAVFQVAIHTDQGSFSGSFVQSLGRATNGTGRVLNESFDSGIPATWTVLDGGVGGGAASKWTTLNPGVRTIAAPMVLPVATVDSDAAGPGATQDESLVSPVLDLSTATAATLQFDEFFRWYAGNADEFADVDVRSSLTGGAWVNVLHQHGVSSANPAHKTVDISAQAAGAADAQVRFRDWNGTNEQYWQLDNVTIDTSAPGSCDMPLCGLPAPGGAKPVADGTFGIAMKGSRADASGSSIAVTWDVATCASADQHILYGDLSSVASLSPTGAACDLGTTGSATWTGVPAGNLWFLVVGDDNAVTEGTWGTDGNTPQRGGTTPSGFCGMTTRDNSGVCP